MTFRFYPEGALASRTNAVSWTNGKESDMPLFFRLFTLKEAMKRRKTWKALLVKQKLPLKPDGNKIPRESVYLISMADGEVIK